MYLYVLYPTGLLGLELFMLEFSSDPFTTSFTVHSRCQPAVKKGRGKCALFTTHFSWFLAFLASVSSTFHDGFSSTPVTTFPSCAFKVQFREKGAEKMCSLYHPFSYNFWLVDFQTFMLGAFCPFIPSLSCLFKIGINSLGKEKRRSKFDLCITHFIYFLGHEDIQICKYYLIFNGQLDEMTKCPRFFWGTIW